jgi:hypothetical protein
LSSTNRGATRLKLDAYYTPQPLANAIVSMLVRDGHLKRGDVVIEPSCGAGAFLLYLAEAGCSVTGVDIDPEVYPDICADFVTLDPKRFAPDAVVGNPPFSHAEAHTRHALKLVSRQGGVVAFLLRLAFMEGQTRAAFWAEHPAAHIYVLTERPSFTGGATDSCAYGVFVWAPHRGPTTLSHLSWRGLRVAT